MIAVLTQTILRKAIPVVAFVLAAGVAGHVFSPAAEAAYGSGDALETVGLATGAGAILGLSTISFYEKPTAHLKNVVVGAGVGMVVGLGVMAYLLGRDPGEDEVSIEELLPPENKPNATDKKKSDTEQGKPEKKKDGAFHRRPDRLQRFVLGSDSPVLASVPVAERMSISQWVIAAPLLELRF